MSIPFSVQGPDRPELRQAIEEIVASGFLGVQLRVNDERGEWVGGAGARRLEGDTAPLTDGHFRIGSSTKSFVATTVLMLVAEGRIGLDAPAADHLPGFGLDRRITVRMLLQHTSGVFNHTGELHEDGTFAPGVPWRGKEWVDNRFRTYLPDELVRLSLSRPARFAPGTGWSYANTNYVLARMVVEQVTGVPFAEELRRLVLEPLGMTGTVAPGTSPEVPEPHHHGYYRYEDAGRERTVDVTRHNPSWVSAGGDMISTTRDLHTYFAALMGGKLLPAALLAEMRTPDPRAGYGLGVFVQDTGARGGVIYHHNGATIGSAALMYSSPDGGTTLTAGLNHVDDADVSIAAAFHGAQQRLVGAVFGGGHAGPGHEA
ncbi:serine hydrolase domain-containing protein [Streptantibioticus cattleyicolor]|uniref:Alkaline D-peptidase n=1 Tax=Streptantibioticus cattleyicolor (strain ATCC 35852 / DSM 46488 / JCM 4925 / NBRC 14057 / NRRL 8057) TaxID=1003195 RepID=F8JN08_STREN|nr:serine hydrolase domain-containing protein [Streptantibioticus cattleyicolor]AEW98333.1 alkaline D-peptidase [Streptantibioticus cattleyicolor NRRL 8057 = DSM 46488]CCB72609.1 Penicillin-binding protein, beta-lactamase class C [Streptantibioticus cattleyicolor NRRL 8057 = DSM 46488]